MPEPQHLDRRRHDLRRLRVKVAKHGKPRRLLEKRRRRCAGGAGVNIDADPATCCRRRFARSAPASLGAETSQRDAPCRPQPVELGTRTIFNLMGRCQSGRGVKRQLIGVFSPQWLEPMANVLKISAPEHAWLVHGNDGLDESPPPRPRWSN